MKIDHRGPGVDRGLRTADRVDVKKPLLEVGRRISSEIISVEGEEVLLKLDNGLIRARNAGSEQLYSGMMAEFEVLRSDKALIEIRPVALSALSAEEADISHLQKMARELGVVDSGDHLQLLAKMLKLDFPLSKAGFEELKLIYLQSAKIGAALLGEVANIAEPASRPALSLDSAKLLEVLTAAPRELVLKSDVLKALSLMVSEPPAPTLEQPAPPLPAGVPEFRPELPSELGPEAEPIKLAQELSPPKEVELAPKAGVEAELSALKHIVKEFRILAGDEPRLMTSLVTLAKHNIRPSMLNMVFSNALLRGDFGLAEAIFELDGGVLDKLEPELKSALATYKSRLLTMEGLEDMDADSLEEVVKIYEELVNKMEEGARSAGLPRELAMISQHSHLVKDMQPMWLAAFLPLMTGSKLDDLEIYVKKEGASKQGDSSRSDKLVYLSLNTANMDRVKIKIDYKKRSLKLSFFTQSKEVEQHIRSLLPRLESALKSMSDKQLSLHVNSEEEDLNLVDFELMSVKPPSKIDVRI